MKTIILVLTMLLTTTTTISAQTMPPLETGVSQTLAKWRAANYSDVRYKLNITLEKGAPLMKGDIEISVKLTDEAAKNDLILDWRTTQFANDKDKPFADVVAVNDASEILYSMPNEHIRISKALLKMGENHIKIQFASPIKTSGAAITRYVDKEDGAEYIYSLFVPSDASTAFPVFDQPDLKARFGLDLRTPLRWKVVSNTAIKNSSTLRFEKESSKQDDDGYTTHTFSETKPISTYVFAFAAGDFTQFSEYDEKIVVDEMLKKQQSEREETRKRRNQPELPEPSPLSRIEIDAKMGTRIYVRKSQAEKFKAHSKEVFRLNREGVKFLESYFDYKFPFPKYDLVLIPEFPFGGMEHAGATFLRESSVIFPTEPTKNDLVSRANVIFHEAAHQWFGDTVTMKWFDDLWLKEGFAEFMAYKTLEKVMPEYNAWKIFYERNKQAAYLTDSTKGTTPIYQEIPNLSAAKSAYGNIVYRKAPSFLKQAEFYLGEKEFQIAVRAFLKKHEFANAEWTDLVKEFETASKQDLKDWANVWVKQRGLPRVKSSWEKVGKLEAPALILAQENILKDGGVWLFKVKVLTNEDNKREITTINFDGKGNPLFYNREAQQSNQYFVFPNYQDYGYGIFLLDEKSRAYVLANIQTEKDDFLRAMMWGALWDSVREGELNPKDYVELVVKVLSSDFGRQTVADDSVKNLTQSADEKPPPKGGTQNFSETDESTINILLGRVSTAMNYYLSDAQRDTLAPRVEDLLIDKIQNAPTQGLRITFYRAFLNIASSKKTRTVLHDIFNGNLGISGGDTKTRAGVRQDKEGNKIYAANPAIPLKTKDRFDIVTKLLILDDENAPRLLAELERTETSDEAKRYAYAAKAAIATVENKAKFWNDFTNNKDLSESYIESAFAVFNAPKHADLTLPYLEKALAELPNLKRNRKIFFVNGWLAAFISGQKSEAARRIVNTFLADNPNLDKDLRLKILENADGLERAVKIRKKFGN